MKRIAALVAAPVAAALLALATPSHAATPTPATTQASAQTSQHVVTPAPGAHRPGTKGTNDSSWGG
ncbi:hypothetical protein AB0F13_03115 [Streptomyces sp. NPDC026206]|uniref:hypothetical protein n=1 Tax=Streptomyces sp. NPDC026206 TaxID=3157089 RepID=UPI0033DE30AB